LPVQALHLPEPGDTRLRCIAEGLATQPAGVRPLATLARKAGLTERSAERLFRKEIGMTFGKWRRELRLLKALEQLVQGESVTNVAMDVGYGDVSALIAMFKAARGVIPAQYFRSRHK
jgi:AraC-like DNA-binding protein